MWCMRVCVWLPAYSVSLWHFDEIHAENERFTSKMCGYTYIEIGRVCVCKSLENTMCVLSLWRRYKLDFFSSFRFMCKCAEAFRRNRNNRILNLIKRYIFGIDLSTKRNYKYLTRIEMNFRPNERMSNAPKNWKIYSPKAILKRKFFTLP